MPLFSKRKPKAKQTAERDDAPHRFTPTFTIGDEAPLYPGMPDETPTPVPIPEEPEFFVPEEDKPAEEETAAAPEKDAEAEESPADSPREDAAFPPADEVGAEQKTGERETLVTDFLIPVYDGTEEKTEEKEEKEQIDFEHLLSGEPGQDDAPPAEPEPTPEQVSKQPENKTKKPGFFKRLLKKRGKKGQAPDKAGEKAASSHPKRKRRILAVILSAVAVLLVGAVIFSVICLRTQYVVLENLTYYQPEEIVAATGISKNSFLPFHLLRASSMERTITTKYPYIRGIDCSLELPGVIVLTLTEDAPMYYTTIEGEYFLISTNMRVLGRYETKEELPAGVRELVTSRISFAVVGYEVRFFEDSYTDYINNILSEIDSSSLSDGITKVNIAYRYNITMEYDGRFLIELGSGTDLRPKLRFVESILAELDKNASGKIHVVNLKTASVLCDE